jgi:putative transposase
MHYRRQRLEGGTYFFTVATFDRRPILIDNIENLRRAFAIVMKERPFIIDAHVIMPDHIHMIWTLPEFDSDYPTRWRLIKHYFSRMILPRNDELISLARISKKERQIWQRRYWEHVIRDDQDLNNHIEYIHYNPIKHGKTKEPGEWEFSSFNKFVKNGYYPPSWKPEKDLITGNYLE